MNKNQTITKSTGQILKENICTLFNLLNILIAAALACVHAWSNMFFIAVVALNTVIGIAQELKAKRLVEKLSLLSAPKVKLLRDDKIVVRDVSDVRVGDLLLLESGCQICADCIVSEGSIEVNESLLTGESDAVYKTNGDALLSGSSVVSGKCRARVIRTGEDSYASKIANEAKRAKGLSSQLVSSMKRVTRLTGMLIPPLGVLLFIESFLVRKNGIYNAVISTSAGLLGMLPKGLYLLISISLAAGVIALSRKKVLVQSLYSLENLAHADTLCLDKTGTLTEGRMRVESVMLYPDCDKELFKRMMGSFLAVTSDNNATFAACSDYFERNDFCKAVSEIPFSSDRKWSAMSFDDGKTFVLGAPEKLSDKALPEELEKQLQSGRRIILAGVTEESLTHESKLSGIRILAAIVIVDPIRKNAVKTINYFKREGVAVKIISGDNPVTVSAVASQAGVENANRYIDMSKVGDENLCDIAERYTVFGRVTPVQKKMLVDALHKNNHTVAMTGDGVNDLLALKEADCSIAVGGGSDAAKQVSQLVLLDSDFAVLKDVLMQGRRVVNNITKSSGVFFIKTIYSILICIICILVNTPFPFVPIQITLIDLIIEGFPSFFASFESDGRQVKTNFLSEAVRRALPNAVAIGACYTLYLCLRILGVMGITGENTQANSLMFLLIGTVGIMGVFKMCYPFNALRGFLAVTTAVGFYTAVGLCLWLKDHLLNIDILKMAVPDLKTTVILVIFAAIAAAIERMLSLTICRSGVVFRKPIRLNSIKETR